MTPSKSIKTRRAGLSFLMGKGLGDHPTPAGRKPPAPPVGFFGSKGPSMLQSCGTSSLRHEASAKFASSAPWASDLRNSQFLSKDVVRRDRERADSDAKNTTATARIYLSK